MMAPCNKSICVQDWDSDLVVLHGLFILCELCELFISCELCELTVLQKGVWQRKGKSDVTHCSRELNPEGQHCRNCLSATHSGIDWLCMQSS